MKKQSGLTLVEIVISLGLVAIIGGLIIHSMNPGGQLAKARNTERQANLNTIALAIRQNIFDNRTGVFACATGDLPTSSKKLAASGGNTYNIASCLIPTYFFVMPFDPKASGAHYTSNTDYDTGYFVQKNASTGQITLTAPAAELGQTILVIR